MARRGYDAAAEPASKALELRLAWADPAFSVREDDDSVAFPAVEAFAEAIFYPLTEKPSAEKIAAQFDVFQAMVEAGLLLDAEYAEGYDLLSLLVANPRIAHFLLEAGADPRAALPDGTTALLDAGADLFKPNGRNETPLQVAKARGHQEVAKLLESLKPKPAAQAPEDTEVGDTPKTSPPG